MALLEEGVSTLVKLEHMSASFRGTEVQSIMTDFSASLAMTLTSLRTLVCGAILLRQLPSLTALTILAGLTMHVEPIQPSHDWWLSKCDIDDYGLYEEFWSGLPKLPFLVSLNAGDAYVNFEIFETIACMTQLTRLRLCGCSDDLQCIPENATRCQP